MTAVSDKQQEQQHSTGAGDGVAAREVKVRRMAFDYPDADLPRHFATGGDLVSSHFVAMLSAVFPEGEDFFVRSVRDVRDQVTDLELRKQVAGFIGQEANHGRVHREFNEQLQARGYPTRFVDRKTKRFLSLIHRTLPQSWQLGATAALEHYTATFAETLLDLDDDSARGTTEIPEVRAIFLWHALEESEHKAVAFDVLRHVYGNEAERIRVMRVTTAVFVAVMALNMTISLAMDPASRNLPRLWRSLKTFRHHPFLSKKVRRRLADYNRRDFHPDDHDSTELLAYWRDELFGQQGELTDMVKRSAS